MRGREMGSESYDTDKIVFGYLEQYDRFLRHLAGQPVVLLELGILNGGSLRLWRDYFSEGLIVGIDLTLPSGLEGEHRIRMFQGSQSDTSFLTEVAGSTAPDGFDVIIDDASHRGDLTKAAFWHLFDNHLKPSGLYVIEDWGTGYWEDWPDGRAFRPRSRLQRLWLNLWSARREPAKVPWHSHSHGMVGFVKQLVDEQGAANLTRAALTGSPARDSKFASM